MIDELWPIVALSLRVAVVATVVALPFGVAMAWLLARHNFKGKWIVDGLVHLPLVLPPVVTGYVLLLLFGRQGPVGGVLESLFGVSLAFRWTGAALASAVMGFPLMVRSIRLAFEHIDPRLEQAAASLGASPAAVFFRISLPLAAPGVLAGSVLAFAKSLGEFGATITFVASIPGETQTLPAAIYALLQVPGGETMVLYLCVIAVALSLVALALSEWFSRRLSEKSA